MAGTRSRPANLAVVRLSSFGDIVLTEPVARAVKQQYPGARLCFFTGDEYAGIPSLFSSVDRVVPYRRGGDNPALDAVALGERFDAVVDLQNNLRSRRITRRLKPLRAVRFRRQRLRRFFLVHLPRIWRGQIMPTVEGYANAIAPLGIRVHDPVPAIAPPADRVGEARARLGLGPFVGICPGGSSDHKRWGEARFAGLVRILGQRGRRVVIVGSDGDRRVIQTVMDAIGKPEAYVYAGNDIAMIAAVLSLCSVTVSNDSGLMHLAAAVGSKVVAVFGPTSPLLGFAPSGTGSRVATLDLPCSPCSYHGNRPCKYEHRACLDDITAEYVADLVNGVANDRSAGRR
jgi:ADP-heptose:LPS heptosyltransferase